MDAPSAKRRGLSLPTKTLLGLVLGAAAGIALNVAYAPAAGAEPGDAYRRVVWWADNVAKPAGDIFLRLLFMVVVPLVFCSLVLGIAGLGDLRKLGRLGGRTFLWFIGTTALAVVLGLTLVNTIQPGRTMSQETAQRVMQEFAGNAKETIAQGAAGTGFSIHTFVNVIPRNIVASAGNEKEALGVIFFALLVGMALTRMASERTRTFLEVLETLYEVCVKILGLALRIAPVGVFGLIFAVTAKLGLEVIGSLMAYVGTAMAGLLFYQLVVLPLLAFVFAGVRPGHLFRGARTLMITAFSTSSSNATLPTTIRTAVEVFGVPKQIAGFVMPLGATMNMNGTALFEGVTVLFLAQVAGHELSLGSQVLVIVLAVMTAIGAAGVPGGSLPLLSIVLSQVGVQPEMIALILGTDRIVDMTRTMPNVTSDLICSLWLARKEGVAIADGR
jgi:DAACS family dicarboxylate/amino acid:cation (Na+ or H+) symporter